MTKKGKYNVQLNKSVWSEFNSSIWNVTYWHTDSRKRYFAVCSVMGKTRNKRAILFAIRDIFGHADERIYFHLSLTISWNENSLLQDIYVQILAKTFVWKWIEWPLLLVFATIHFWNDFQILLFFHFPKTQSIRQLFNEQQKVSKLYYYWILKLHPFQASIINHFFFVFVLQ